MDPESLVVYSTDIRQENVELVRAEELHLPLLHRSELSTYNAREKAAPRDRNSWKDDDNRSSRHRPDGS